MNQPHREVLKHRVLRDDSGEESYLGFNARCIRKFGPAAGTFLRQLVYWTGKEHDPQGWIYKTQSEMEEETGLSRRHQEKARKILRKAGVIEEVKKGTPCRLWYGVDLEALLSIMETSYSTMNQWRRKMDRGDDSEQTNNRGYSSLDHITEQFSEDDSTLPTGEDVITSLTRVNPNSAPASEDDTADQPITESTPETTAGISTGNHMSEKSNLQFGEDRISRGLLQDDKKEAAPPKSSVGGRELNRIFYLLDDSDSAAYRAYKSHREGSLSLQDLANEVCLELTGSRDQVKFYIEPVRRMVAELAIDDGASEPPRDTRI